MASPSFDLEQFLEHLSQNAQAGDRLPTIRDLMRRFGVSQMVVQRAFDGLKARGLIASEVGRGTFFRGGAPAQPAPPVRAAPGSAGVKSVLLLRRSISIARGRVLLDGLQQRFAAEGHRVLELSYNDPGHALAVLKGLPRFDACVVQSTYRTLTIGLLAALKEKSEVLAVDGAALAGADVDAVGMEWGEPLARAVALLERQGHRSIACAITAQPLLATQLGRRRLAHLRESLPHCRLHEIALPQLPDEDYEGALVLAIRQALQAPGDEPFTALVAWGIESGARFREALARIGVAVPSDLSVVLLGRTDLANEHADFFDTIGCSVADQAEQLHGAIHARWSAPDAPYSVRMIPVTSRAGQSVAAAGPVRRARATARA